MTGAEKIGLALALVVIAYRVLKHALHLVVSVFRGRGGASKVSANPFLEQFAPTVGLTYVVTDLLPTLTPLLGAGQSRLCIDAMTGPLFGADGGPECTLAHFDFQEWAEEGETPPWRRFTVCAMEIADALPVFRGVFVKPRSLSFDWFRTQSEEIALESAAFEHLLELRAAPDQDRLAVRELLSPSLIVWLAESPLRLGLECKGGGLVVYVPGHESDPDALTAVLEAGREAARRVIAASAAAIPVTQAG